MGNKIIPYIKRNRSILIAIVLYFITCYTLFLIEYRLYVGTIETDLFLFVIYPIVVFLYWVFSDKSQHKTQLTEKRENTSRVLVILGYILFISIVCYEAIREKFQLKSYLMITVVLLIIVFEFIERKQKIKITLSQIAIISFSCICAVTLSFVIIVHPCSLSTAKQMITKKGYESPTYITNVDNVNELTILVNSYTQLHTKNEDKLGYYFYQAKKEQKNYMVFVSVVNKKIVCEEPGEYDRISLDIIKNI